MANSNSTTLPMPKKLWEPPNPEKTEMARFMRGVNERRGMALKTFKQLYDWSIGDRREEFWADLWDFVDVVYEGSYKEVVEPNVRMDHIPRWFHGIRLNFAENVLYSPSRKSPSITTTTGKEDSKIAVTEVREGCTQIRDVTWGALRHQVGTLASAMRAHGVKKGDRVAVVASNSVDTLCVFLAVTSLGGLFSSSSTDMGTKGVLDRLTQIRPRWLFMDDAALYNGKNIDLRQKMGEIVQGMAGVKEFDGVVSMPRWESPVDVATVPRCQTLKKYLERASTSDLEFERVEFADPFLVVYSSGTTGQPKCIVHGTGGVIISGQKENRLHRNFSPATVALQYTTTGWIMYLTSVMALLQGARTVLYDGSPFLPDLKAFVKLVGDQKVTKLGISPRWLQTYASAHLYPRELTDLSALRTVTSTGMVLSDSLFNWFYTHGFPAHTQLANISGGTDLAGCFGLENQMTPVYVGGCQGPCLGTAVEVYDSEIEGGVGVKGRPVGDGVPGDLVGTKSFPNMPVMFWGERGRERYFDAYFGKYDNVWTHGDFIQRHPVTGQILFLGRADGVLNPSGVRFGSAEIYAVIEHNFAAQVLDSVVVGQRRPTDQDESVMLFLKMQPGHPFTPALVAEIKAAIARECSKRHVPRYVFETPEIPTTVNLKKVELPVKQIVSGRIVKPSGTLLNPESLAFYYRFAKVEEIVAAGRSRL